MEEIIECVPNFSSSNPKIISQISAAITSTPGVTLAQQTSDPDHNRSVFTFFGKAESVIEAAFQSIKVAKELIDIRKHQGVHPFMGSCDVCPLIPLKGLDYGQCNKYAHRLAKRVGEELQIPIYLYEQSATRPENHNLANIRNREGYKHTAPDYGPHKPQSAGVTAIGVRKILIAYNVNLESNDLKKAKEIAKEIRKLPEVKALGLYLKHLDRVQISTNLTDYQISPPALVFRAIKAEAAKHKINILESELIGMLPRAAISDPEIQELQFREFDQKRFLEEWY